MGQEQQVDKETEEIVKKMADRVKVEDEKPKEADREEKAEKKPKKKKGGVGKFISRFFMVLGVILLIGVLYAGWLGFVPGLSNLMGSHSPKDLGITYTQADLDSFHDKTDSKVLNYENSPTNSLGKKTIFANVKTMNIDLTEEELTAKVNSYSEWVYMPVQNVQIRVNEDGSVEASANLSTERVDEFVNFIGGVGYSSEDVQTGLDWLGRFAGDPAIYLKGAGEINNNSIQFDLLDVKIGRWTPPMDEAYKVIYTGLLNGLAGIVGLDINSAAVKDGQIHFDGQGPTTIYVKNR